MFAPKVDQSDWMIDTASVKIDLMPSTLPPMSPCSAPMTVETTVLTFSKIGGRTSPR